MNVFRIDFDEVYRRHLCRHGHLGINLFHLLAFVGIYVAVYGIACNVIPFEAPLEVAATLVIMSVPWFVLVARNVPLRVSLATGFFTLLLVAISTALAWMPLWYWPLQIILMHYLQQWSHRVYRMHRDMSSFNSKYVKGPQLFVLLLIYELPILLNYLLFGREDWIWGTECLMERQDVPVASPPG
jgi:hypothetical protein